MSINRLLTQQVEIAFRYGVSFDEYGNEVSSFNGGDPYIVLGYLEQEQSVETLNDRDTVVSTWKAYLPADTSINAFDRILFMGRTFEVDGEPWRVFNPRTASESHLVCTLKVVK